MTPYPTTVPTDEIKDVLATIASKNFVANKTQFVKDVWTIQGYCLFRAVGEVSTPPPGMMRSGPPPALDDPEILGHLESMCSDMPQARPPGTLMTIAKWAIQAILMFI